MTAAPIPALITYHKPGTRPPIYVAGTFSDPPWQPYEMDYTTREDGEHDFKKEVCGEAGSEIQYKFRIGEGDWWALSEDAPIVTDSEGNANHVLRLKPAKEQPHEVSTEDRTEPSLAQSAPDRQGTDDKTGVVTSARLAAKQLQPSIDAAAGSRSGTGTPIFARTAAEVADSAALLHEEVPDRESAAPAAPSAGIRAQKPSQMSEEAETAAEVADTAEKLDSDENTILILEPLPGEGDALEIQEQGDVLSEDQEEYIAHTSPLFAHECAGLYEWDQEVRPPDTEEEYAPARRTSSEDIDPDAVDLNDPTLERFPSNREEIVDTVRKLGTGLQADQASFDGSPPSPVINPSRRGTEDITGDYLLAASQPSPPARQHTSKQLELGRSQHGSTGSVPTCASLHSISELEEPLGDEEGNFPPAVVFSNPDMKPRPEPLKFPTIEEDEGVALPDGVSPDSVSPTTVKAERPPLPRNIKLEGPLDISDALAGTNANSAKDPERPAQESGTSESAAAKKGPTDDRRLQAAEGGDGEGASSSRAAESQFTVSPSNDSNSADTTKATAVDADRSNQLRRRGPQEEAPKNPESAQLSGPQPSHGVGWIKAFFKLLFVDLIGGLISRLCGGRRNMLLTAGSAAVILGLGYGWWTMADKNGRWTLVDKWVISGEGQARR
ncbi:hypothetical protein VTK56DRAFT_5201 [Thermocarpiscus australiensis]